MGIKIKQFIILIGDAGVMFGSLWLALTLRYSQFPNSEIWQTHFHNFIFIFPAWILIFYIFNLYKLHSAVNNFLFLQTVSKSFILGGIFSFLFFYLNPTTQIAPKTNLVLFIIIFGIGFLVWRRFFNFAAKSYLPKKNIALAGTGAQIQELAEEVKKNPHLGYNLSLIIKNNETVQEIKEKIKKEKISILIITDEVKKDDELSKKLFSCLDLKINFVNFAYFYEQISGKIPIEAIGATWFLENLNEENKKIFDAGKRVTDIIISLILIIFTLPFWILIGLIIKIESSGPIFFKQKRIGRGGKIFNIIKFRTMREHKDEVRPAAENDNRITKFGMFLRKTRIDEIPQAINILKGEMSFVGPRPERPELASKLEKKVPFYRQRLLVKPGATGSDQISGEYHSPSEEDTMKKLQYDLFYIKNRSGYLDLSIILKTIATVISRAGR